MDWGCFEMNFIINYLLITLPEFYIFILFSIILFGYKFHEYKLKVLYMAAITAFVSDFLWLLDVEVGLRVLVTFITIFILYLKIIKPKWILSFFMTFTSFLVLIIPEILIVTILLQFIDYQLILENIFVKFFVVFIEYLPIVIAIYIMHKKNKNLSKLVNRMQSNKIVGYWVQIFFLIAIQIYLIIFLNYTVYIKKYVLFNTKEIPKNYYTLLLSILLFLVYIILIKVIINLKNKYADIEVSKTESNYNENLEGLLVKLRMERHDNISQVQAIYGMVEEEKYEMLKEYLNDIVETIKSTSINHTINIKNIPLSAFLHTKMECLDSLGIDFRINVETSDAFKEIKSVDLVKIVSNILDNAIRAVTENNINNPYIELNWGKENNNAIIKISNNGPKINKNTIELLFKEGYTTKKSMENSGYGLAIVKSIINKYKGNIEVKSTKEITSFKFSLPLK